MPPKDMLHYGDKLYFMGDEITNYIKDISKIYSYYDEEKGENVYFKANNKGITNYLDSIFEHMEETNEIRKVFEEQEKQMKQEKLEAENCGFGAF